MAQSPELASGAGFSFEDQVGASYLVALLTGGHCTGAADRVVSRVAFQQRDFGEPLDDLVIDAVGCDGTIMRLGVQCKRSLIISDALGNEDFRSIIRDCWATRTKTDFKKGVDRYGAAAGYVAADPSRTLRTLCELARNSVTIEHFRTRMSSSGNASVAIGTMRDKIRSLLSQTIGHYCTDDQLHDFLSHFVLITFDFLHEGSTDLPAALNQLSSALAAPAGAEAPLAWAKLLSVVRLAGGSSGEYDRQRLVRELTPVVRLLPARVYRHDLETLAAMARQWAADIEPTVNGVHLERPGLRALVEQALRVSPFVRMIGLPGSGKSVLLRDALETELAKGPVLFLKHDRLTGKSWSSFAAGNGLSNGPLAHLLAELSAVGSATLFIDGLDRIPVEQRGVVLDVARTILDSPGRTEWRILATLRTTSIDTVWNWMGSVLDRVQLETVDVGYLSDEEAGVLARSIPALADLLFGNDQVREIARRPFFARVLVEGSSHSVGVVPRSEIDLADRWWQGGASLNPGVNEGIRRRVALLELADLAVRTPGPVALGRMSARTAENLDKLVEEGILVQTPAGHAFAFSHDIFFEWSLFHLFEDRQGEWLEELRSWGEPPSAGRAVELRSQREFSVSACWSATLQHLRESGMRSQWTRAWLIAPLALPSFPGQETAYSDQLMADGGELMRALLVWFQAERTMPNPHVLAGNDLDASDKIRVADALGWPSDFRTWQRLIAFLLQRASIMPRHLRPSVLTVFDVWQNACFAVRNDTSSSILRQCEIWLDDIDATAGAAQGGVSSVKVLDTAE